MIHRRRTWPHITPTVEQLHVLAAVSCGRIWHCWVTGRSHHLAADGKRLADVTDLVGPLRRAGLLTLHTPAGGAVIGPWRTAARGRTALAVFLLGWRSGEALP